MHSPKTLSEDWIALEYSDALTFLIHCGETGVHVYEGSKILIGNDVPEGIRDREWFEDLITFHEDRKILLPKGIKSILVGKMVQGEFILQDVRRPDFLYLSYAELLCFSQEFGIPTAPLVEQGTYIECLAHKVRFVSKISRMFGKKTTKPRVADGITVRPMSNLYFENLRDRPIVIRRKS